jgi:hypothetical protein
MIVLALVLFVLQVVFATTVFMFVSTGLIPTSTVVSVYNKAVDIVKRVVLYIARKPVHHQMMAIAALAAGHQAAMFYAPSQFMLWAMGNWFEEKMLQTRTSQQMEKLSNYVRKRKWLTVATWPLVVYAVAVTFMITVLLYLVFDPHISSTVLFTLALPVGVSLLVWWAEETFVPLFIRKDWLGTYSSVAKETPTAGEKRKILLAAAATIAVVTGMVTVLRFYNPTVLQFILGRKLDIVTYMSGVTVAIAMAAAMASIQFDGQTRPREGEAGSGTGTEWGKNNVRDYYHQLLALMCIVVLAAFIAFPLFNNPYFSYIMMVTSSV